MGQAVSRWRRTKEAFGPLSPWEQGATEEADLPLLLGLVLFVPFAFPLLSINGWLTIAGHRQITFRTECC